MTAKRHGPRNWREALALVREMIDAAEAMRDRERRHALIRACRLLIGIDAPGWHRRGTRTVRVATTNTREFDRLELALERRLADLVGDCIGCHSRLPLPEDRART